MVLVSRLPKPIAVPPCHPVCFWRKDRPSVRLHRTYYTPSKRHAHRKSCIICNDLIRHRYGFGWVMLPFLWLSANRSRPRNVWLCCFNFGRTYKTMKPMNCYFFKPPQVLPFCFGWCVLLAKQLYAGYATNGTGNKHQNGAGEGLIRHCLFHHAGERKRLRILTRAFFFVVVSPNGKAEFGSVWACHSNQNKQ